MNLILNNNVLSVVNNTIPNYASLKETIGVYVSKNIPTQYPIVLVIYNADKEMVSCVLEQVSCDKENYHRYAIPEDKDFALNEGNYNCFLMVINPIACTHIPTNTIKFSTEHSSDNQIIPMVTSNPIDDVIKEVKNIRAEIKSDLEKITALTKMNIEINEKIKQKVED